ncbi:5-oxoprolinase subunit C family protein [Bacillus solitudinis]|uniref:5-oxoprolinase subunit C family protein n=1 Tax=Bacillus solitudinis TaxID=2014074 RepID=UPI001D0CE453|nr:biotin-dependent carboxyltransferase family protein [Bacillus solitudinis]
MAMSEACFKVVKAGLLTTVQDAGRRGYLHAGVVASGVMDPFAYRISNLLVGNSDDAAVLEATMVGPTLLAERDQFISICGADLSATIQGRRVPLWASFRMRKGEQLSFGKPVDGVRAYIAVRGGIDVPKILGSRSTYLKGKLGGFNGRALQKGDSLCAGKISGAWLGHRLAASFVPSYKEKVVSLRVLLGPDKEMFTKEGINHFLSTYYKLTNASDRMGCRLTGAEIEHADKADILSDAVTFGTIQVPKNGQPIILLADRQTTGGYPRIAHVIDVDLQKLGQLKPGQEVRFKEIDIETAQKMASGHYNWLRWMRLSIDSTFGHIKIKNLSD